MAAPQQFNPRAMATVNAVESHVEALRRDTVGRVQDRFENDTIDAVLEEAEEGRLPVVLAESALEPGVGDGASPALADGGGAWTGGGGGGSPKEDLRSQAARTAPPASCRGGDDDCGRMPPHPRGHGDGGAR